MPRKKEKKTSTTYHKSKNGRYYKKTMLPSGKCQCRFVSKKEAGWLSWLFGTKEKPRERKYELNVSDQEN